MIDYRERKPIQNSTERKPSSPLSERKPIPKNQPRRESGGLFAAVAVLALMASFGSGLVAGWFFFKGSHVAPAAGPPQATKKEAPAPTAPRPASNEPLTFYQTLPAGGKGALGSGLNLKPAEHPTHAPATAPATAPAATPAPAPAATPAAPAATQAVPAATPAATSKPAQSKAQPAPVRYVVQTASYREKKEAEATLGKLSAKGLAAYVVEAKTPDKGVWYRVRIGKHLTREEANELAGTAGQGAVVVAE